MTSKRPPPTTSAPKTSARNVQRDMFRYAGVGAHFAATIGLFAWFGYWADGRWGTGPWLLLVGVFLGFGLGLRSLVAKLGHGGRSRPR